MNRDQREGEAPIPELTKRQREVLELLTRGYSNPQIAEALGISLDGAKWHVSEVMAKLGAESRQGAAERWRRHQRLRARAGRALRALVPAALWAKVVAGGVCLAVVAAGIVVVTSGVPFSAPGSGTSNPNDAHWLALIDLAQKVDAGEATVALPTPSVRAGVQLAGCDDIPQQIHFSYTAGEPGPLPGTGQTEIEFTDVSTSGNGPSYAIVVNWHDSLAACDPRIQQIVTGTKADAAQADAQLCQRMETIAQGTSHPDPSEELPSPRVAARYFAAFCESAGAPGNTPPALATHVADYLPPGHACAAIGYPPLHVSFEANEVVGVVDTRTGFPLSGQWQVLFPQGFRWGERNGQRVVLSADGSIVIRDGEIITNPAVCLFDGKFYMDESISVTPVP